MIVDVEEYLDHHGIKGMKWGIRKESGASVLTNHTAKKDAEEFIRAKLFFGEGAGTRRKLIKAKVEGRSAKDPAYKKAFDLHVAKQDMSQHASRAASERRRKDLVKNNKQRAGFLARRLTGEQGTQAAFAAAAVAGIAFLSSPKGQALMFKGFDKINNLRQSRVGAKLVSDFIKSQGG